MTATILKFHQSHPVVADQYAASNDAVSGVLPPDVPEPVPPPSAGSGTLSKNAQKALNNDEPSLEAGPQAQASHCQDTGVRTLAGREGRFEGEAASADLPTLSPAAFPQAAAPEPTPVPTNGSGAPNLPATASEEPVDGSPATAQMGPHAVTVVGSESGTFTPPAFLLKDSKPYVLRPHCQRPEMCGGYGAKHCGTCERASRDSEAA